MKLSSILLSSFAVTDAGRNWKLLEERELSRSNGYTKGGTLNPRVSTLWIPLFFTSIQLVLEFSWMKSNYRSLTCVSPLVNQKTGTRVPDDPCKMTGRILIIQLWYFAYTLTNVFILWQYVNRRVLSLILMIKRNFRAYGVLSKKTKHVIGQFTVSQKCTIS